MSRRNLDITLPSKSFGSNVSLSCGLLSLLCFCSVSAWLLLLFSLLLLDFIFSLVFYIGILLEFYILTGNRYFRSGCLGLYFYLWGSFVLNNRKISKAHCLHSFSNTFSRDILFLQKGMAMLSRFKKILP